VSRVPGGIYVHRDHKGDANGRAPYKLVEAAKQREAMKLVVDSAFNYQLPNLPPDLLNHLAASRWSHWGTNEPRRLDFAIHGVVLMMQERLLTQLLSTSTLNRLTDSELKIAAEADAYTLAEHLRAIVDGAFSEIKADPKAGQYTNRKPYISSFRRNLQRALVSRLSNFVNPSGFDYPEDAKTLARMHMSDLDKQITKLLEAKDVTLDDYTKAHLLDSQERIRKVLNATITQPVGGLGGAFILP
jgi:hypothetical protein